MSFVDKSRATYLVQWRQEKDNLALSKKQYSSSCSVAEIKQKQQLSSKGSGNAEAVAAVAAVVLGLRAQRRTAGDPWCYPAQLLFGMLSVSVGSRR